jgi:flagellar basal body-associated protein FliL
MKEFRMKNKNIVLVIIAVLFFVLWWGTVVVFSVFAYFRVTTQYCKFFYDLIWATVE